MSCSSCKGTKKVSTVSESSSLSNFTLFKNYVIKSIVFLIMMLCMPFIIIALIWILFKSIVLSKHVDVIPALRQLLIKLNSKTKDAEDEDDEYDEDLTEDEYEPMNIEIIKN